MGVLITRIFRPWAVIYISNFAGTLIFARLATIIDRPSPGSEGKTPSNWRQSVGGIYKRH
jgi:hypothetical protein